MGRARFLRSLWFLDLAWLVLAILFATFQVFDVWMPWLATTPTGTLMPSVGLTVVGALFALYVTNRAGQSAPTIASYGQPFAIVMTTLTITAVGLLLSREYFSRGWLVITFVVWFALMLVHRILLRARPVAEPMVIITREKALSDGIDESPYAHVVATVEPDGDPAAVPLLEEGTLVIDLRTAMSEEMARFVSSVSMSGQRVRPLVEVYEDTTGRLPLVHILGGWEVARPVARSRYAPLKRVIDLIAVVATAVIWLPLVAIVWLIVKADSRGPAIYRQARIGKDGELFTLRKFRTMVPDAEPDGPRFAEPDDPRLTRVGGFLRKLRLDELPQIFNVVVGDLSIVGPRPERPVFVERYSATIPFYQSRLLVRPGITGWAQVHRGYGDSEEDAIDKLTYDLYYVKHSSLWLDVSILGKTVWTVLTARGAR